MAFELTARDRARLEGVHPDLVRVIERAAEMSDAPFVVLEGVRTVERQRQLMASGASQTMNSRHIPAANGLGHATDIAPVADGKASFAWPLYFKLAPIVKAAAAAEGVPIEWGGDWKKFKDGPHWQLPWSKYPGKSQMVGLFDAQPQYQDEPTPDDFPYEIEKPVTAMTSKTIWSGGGILAMVGSAFTAIWNNAGTVAIICLTVIVCLVLVILRERIKKFAEDALG